MVLCGFLIFFSAAPLLNPVNSAVAAALYQDPRRFGLIVQLYLLALFSLFLGSASAPKPNQHTFWVRALSFEVSPGRLWRWYLLTSLVTAVFIAALAALNNINPLDYFLRSRYISARLVIDPVSIYLDSLSRFMLVALGALSGAVLALSSGWGRRLITFLILSICGLYALGTGTRYYFLYIIGGAFLVWLNLRYSRSGMLSRLRLNSRIIAMAIGLGLIGIVLTQMIVVRNTQGGLPAYLAGGPRLAGPERFIDSGLDQNTSLEVILDVFPEKRPYIGGMSFLSTFVLFVPRQIWPDKPSTLWTYLEDFALTANPNASYSIIGELYGNFDVIGVVAGMWAVGVFIAMWSQPILKRWGKAPLIVLYSMSLPAFLFLVRGDFQAAIGFMIYPMLVCWIVLRRAKAPDH